MTKKTIKQVTDNKSFNVKLTLTKQPSYVPKTSILNFEVDPLPIENKVYRRHIIFIADVSASMRDGTWLEKTEWLTPVANDNLFPKNLNETIIEYIGDKAWTAGPNDGILLSQEAIVQVIKAMAESPTDTVVSGITFSHDAKIFLDRRPLPKTAEDMSKLETEIKKNSDFDREGGTDFIEAFSAIKDNWLESKEEESVSIYLLTDGQHQPVNKNNEIKGEASQVSDRILEILAKKTKVPVKSLKSKITVYSFGIGSKVNEQAIAPLHRTTGGNFFLMEDTKSIPRYLKTIADSVTAFNVNVRVKSCMVRVGNQLKDYFNFEAKSMKGLDKQTHGFQLSDDFFTNNASIHFLLVDDNNNEVAWIVYEGLNTLHNNPFRDPDVLALFYTRAGTTIAQNKMLSVTQRIGQLRELKQSIKKLLREESEIKENNKLSLEETCKQIDDSIEAITAGNDISKVMLELTMGTGHIALYNHLTKVQAESEKLKKKIANEINSDKSSRVVEIPPCFSPDTLPIREFVSNCKIDQAFAYYEQPATSLNEVATEAEVQRLITIIQPQDLAYLIDQTSQISTSRDPASLVLRVYEFFNRPEKPENDIQVNSVIDEGKKIYPLSSAPEIFLNFRDFIQNKSGNCINRAVALAMLFAAYMEKSDPAKISIYHSFAFTGKPHAFVLLEFKQYIFIADPVFNEFIDIKPPQNRQDTLMAYKMNDLDGILYSLAITKNWTYPLGDTVPLTPVLVGEEVEDAESQNLIDSTTLENFHEPVYFYSEMQAQKDKENGVEFHKQGIFDPAPYEKKNVKEYLKRNVNLTPLGVTLIPEYKLVPAKDVIEASWVNNLAVASRRPGAFLTLVGEVKNPSPAFVDLRSSRHQYIQKGKRNRDRNQYQGSMGEIPIYYAHRVTDLELKQQVDPSSSNSLLHDSKYDHEEIKTSPKNKQEEIKAPILENFSKIQIFMTRRKHLAFKFVNEIECKSFLKLCGSANVPLEYRQIPKEGNTKDEQILQAQAAENDRHNKDWLIPVRFDGGDSDPCVLYFSRSVINGRNAYYFNQINVLKNIITLLKLAKGVSKDPFVNLYAGGHLAVDTHNENNGIISLPPTSILLKEGGGLEVENGKVTETMIKRTADGAVPVLPKNTGLTSKVATFSSSSSSSSSTTSTSTTSTKTSRSWFGW